MSETLEHMARAVYLEAGGFSLSYNGTTWTIELDVFEYTGDDPMELLRRAYETVK